MAGFVFGPFRGAVPGVAAHWLQEGQAQACVNYEVREGDLVPMHDVESVETLPKMGTIETIWLFAGQHWFHWAADVDVLDGPVANDTENRTYFTGDGAPAITYAGIATSSGDGVYPSNSYRLGVPAPATAPSVSASGTPDDENDIGEDRTYVYTYVSEKGEEGPPSGPSAQVLWKPGQSVEVTNMDTAPTGNFNITAKRIYRTASGADQTAFQFVVEVGIAATSHTDTADTDTLGEILPSTTWDMPPDELRGLTAMPNGILAGFRANDLCFCEAYLPHAWPVGYRLQTEPDIVAIGSFGNSLVVATESYPYIVTGTSPSAMAMQKLEVPYPCMSKRGLVDMGYAVVYPTPDGLIRFSNRGPELITSGVFTPSQWRSYKPESMHGVRLDERVLMFYDTGAEQGAMLIPLTGDWVLFIDLYASAAWLEPNTGTLYLVQNNNELKTFGGGAALTGRWRSGVRMSARPLNLGAARVDAESYPVTFRLFADNEEKTSRTVSDSQPFVLPGGYMSQRYAVEIEGDARVRKVEVAESAVELARL